MSTILRCECAWCGLLMRDGETPCSHSICTACSAKMDAELDQRKAANDAIYTRAMRGWFRKTESGAR